MLLASLVWAVGVAAAAPVATGPVSATPWNVELTGVLSTDRVYLRVPGCSGACTAFRREHYQGGEATVWVLPQLGFYGGAAHESEATDAALYAGAGFRAYAGVKGSFALRPELAVDAWGTLTHTETVASPDDADPGPYPDQAKRNQLEAGGVVRFGRADEGLDAWAGVEVMPYSVDRTRVVQGDAVVRTVPWVPVSAVGGVRLVSDALGGPWATRGRLSAGVSGSLGYRVSVTGWLTASL